MAKFYSMTKINHTMTNHALLKTLCLMAIAASLVGCVDAEALIQSRQKMAILARLEEIDLGEFRVTLPKPAEGADIAELCFHAFGLVANSDLEQVQEALDNQGVQFRHELLLAVRQLDVSDLEDPQLEALRSHIEDVMNAALPGEPLQSVGFYSFAYANF